MQSCLPEAWAALVVVVGFFMVPVVMLAHDRRRQRRLLESGPWSPSDLHRDDVAPPDS
jgi:hypothetical protein